MMKKLLRAALSLAAAAVLLFGFSPLASADFNHNLIIDDTTFNNTASMGIAQINSFLNQFPSSCISPNNGFVSPDPTGYSPSTGYTYGGNVSGGQVIYDAAQAYGLNPQVLIATLQKESSVVTGTASYHCQYINTAMGYGCPDSGSCPTNPATMSGFSKQVIHAAWLFKFGEQRSEGNMNWNVQANNSPQAGDHWDNSDDPQTCYGGPMTQGYRQVCPSGGTTFYDGYTTIDGSSVHIDSGATAAMYWYTPHFSGNQNFITIYNGWFGSTVSNGINLDRGAGAPLGVVFNVDGRLQIVGVADNDSMYTAPESSAATNTWAPWSQLPGAARNIAAELSSNGLIQLVSVAGNGNIYTSSQTAANTNTWTSWAQTDGALADAALARNYDGSLELFGAAANGSIYHKRQSSPNVNTWSPWEQLPGALKSITADTNLDGRIQLVGVANNGNVYTSVQTAANADSWSGWSQTDGGLASAALVHNSDGSLEIFGIAPNGAIYDKRQSAPNSGSWGSWTKLNGGLKNIAAEINNNGRIQLVGVAGNGSVYTSVQTAANSDSWSGWSQLPGALRKY